MLSTDTYFTAYTQIIIVFAQQLEAEGILREGSAQGIMTKDFVWIGGDTLAGLNKYPFVLLFFCLFLVIFFCFLSVFFFYFLFDLCAISFLLLLSIYPTDALLGNLVITPSATANTPLAKQYLQQMSR